MIIFLFTLVFFLVIISAMAIGYVFQKKELAGSCGGLGIMGIEKACDCDNPCDKRVKREAALAKKSKMLIDIQKI